MSLSTTNLYVATLLVIADMAITVVAIIFNLVVVVAIKETQDMISDLENFFQLNMVLNNLLICVLVKSFEVVFTGFAAATQQSRSVTTLQTRHAF